MMDDVVTLCDICGDEGWEDRLAICNKCTDGAEHTYCMHDMLDQVPEGWMCEDCKSECQKSKSPVNLESSSSSKLKFKSSHAWKRQTQGISSRSYPSANRHGVQSLKKDRVIKMSAEPPKPCHNTLLHRDFSCKTIKNGKAKATKDFTSELQISCNCQKKAKVGYAYCVQRCENTLEVELDRKRKTLDERSKFPTALKPSNKSLLSRESPFKNLGKANVKQSSYGSQEKPKLPSYLGNESSTLGSQTEIARVKFSPLLKSEFKGQLAKVGYLPKRKEETKATKGKYVSGVAAEKSENRTISRNETSISGSNCCRLDAVQSCEQQKNRDTVSSWALDCNVNPQDGIDMVGIDEFDAMDTRSSGDRVLLGGGDNYNSGCSDSRQFLDGKMETPESVLDLNISVRPESAAPEVDPCLSVGNVGDKPSKDVKGKMPMEENNDADNVKLRSKLPMDEKNNADRPESSTKPSLSFASPTSYEENLNLLHWQAAETLSSLLWIKKNLGLEWRRNNSS